MLGLDVQAINISVAAIAEVLAVEAGTATPRHCGSDVHVFAVVAGGTLKVSY